MFVLLGVVLAALGVLFFFLGRPTSARDLGGVGLGAGVALLITGLYGRVEQRRIASLTKEIVELQVRVEGLSAEAGAAKTQSAQLAGRNAALKAEIERLERENDEAKSSEAETLRRLEEAREKEGSPAQHFVEAALRAGTAVGSIADDTQGSERLTAEWGLTKSAVVLQVRKEAETYIKGRRQGVAESELNRLAEGISRNGGNQAIAAYVLGYVTGELWRNGLSEGTVKLTSGGRVAKLLLPEVEEKRVEEVKTATRSLLDYCLGALSVNPEVVRISLGFFDRFVKLGKADEANALRARWFWAVIGEFVGSGQRVPGDEWNMLSDYDRA